MLRPRVLDALGHVVHGRIAMEGLQAATVLEMQKGYQPLVFGTYWTRDHIDALAGAGHGLEVAWHLLKWIQAPAAVGRIDKALEEVHSLSSLAAIRKATIQTATNPSTATNGLTASQSQAPTAELRRRVG